MTGTAYPDMPRVDASEKVRGATLYAADDARPGLLHGALATATIARGAITTLDTAAAAGLRGREERPLPFPPSHAAEKEKEKTSSSLMRSTGALPHTSQSVPPARP